MEEKKYPGDGSLIVSELSHCPYFEANPSAPRSCSKDCYFCKYSDFRKREYIERIESERCAGILYSVCHNENNKAQNRSDNQNKEGRGQDNASDKQ